MRVLRPNGTSIRDIPIVDAADAVLRDRHHNVAPELVDAEPEAGPLVAPVDARPPQAAVHLFQAEEVPADRHVIDRPRVVGANGLPPLLHSASIPRRVEGAHGIAQSFPRALP